ncbi:hypothetical protein Droror1_Dr00008312 [Drosera rotundifolia]
MRCHLGMACSVILVVLVLHFDGYCNGQGQGDGRAPMIRAEQEALYSAIQGFVGNSWNGSDLYPDPCGWTPIQGVACDLFDGIWYITDVNIGPVHDNSLTCGQNVEFRPQLFQLSHLETLSIFNCITSHHHPITLPERSWERLATSLNSLEFRSNPALVGPIPTNFGILMNLQSLILQDNGLNGQIPLTLGNLGNLKRLVISGNKVTGQVPYSLGNPDQLLIMDLSRNQLSGSLPSTFGRLVSLLKLDLSNNTIMGPIPYETSFMKSLTLLDLRNNNISGGLTLPFKKMQSLAELALARNPLGGDLHSIKWQHIRNLVFLDLSSCGLTGQIPASITEMTRLRYVDLSKNKLTGDITPRLETMLSMSTLFVHDNMLTGELKFTHEYYVKMGKRFGAWGNPDLCYAGQDVPIGVRPCQRSEVTFHDDSESKNQIMMMMEDSDSSLGSSMCEGIWWAFTISMLMNLYALGHGDSCLKVLLSISLTAYIREVGG